MSLIKTVDGKLTAAGVTITRGVGTMWCALAFACLALVSLPDAINAGRPAIVSWVAQTFLQLVLLSIIMVGQAAAADKLDSHHEAIHAHLDRIEGKP